MFEKKQKIIISGAVTAASGKDSENIAGCDHLSEGGVDTLLTRKKIIYIMIAAVICIFIFSVLIQLIPADNASRTHQRENDTPYFFGTYQSNSLDDAQYIAVIPPSSDEGRSGRFQWYNINNVILQEGFYHIYKNDYMIFYMDGQKSAVIVDKDGHYFLSDGSAPQELRKISEEAIVCRPVR